MELMEKQGYKQTEVGMIPEDWEVVKVKDITIFHKQGFYTTEKYKSNSSYYLLRGTDMQNPIIDFTTTPKINATPSDYEAYKVLENDFLFVRSGAIGRYGIANHSLPKSIFGSYLINFRFLKEITPHYFGYYYESNLAKNQLLSITQGGGNLNINAENIKALNFVYPPTLTEQKAIATALSDVDALITNLEQTITKKKAIKQGAMQQLLTPPHKGGKRLPGFTGEWEEKKLGDLIYDFQNGYAFSAKGYQDSGIPIVTMAQIGLSGQFQFNENKVNYWSKDELKNLKDFILTKGDVIISMTDVTPEKNLIGRMTIVDTKGPLFLNQRVGHLRLKKEQINAVVLKHLSNMRNWRTYSKAIASLGVQANIGSTDIKNGTFVLPGIEEQKAIAQILSDMDAEITQLETKKEKYQAIKQGMMQELLTGKTRLI